MNVARTAQGRRDPARMLQITSMDPGVRQGMAEEAERRDITFGRLVADMWRAYCEFRWDDALVPRQKRA